LKLNSAAASVAKPVAALGAHIDGTLKQPGCPGARLPSGANLQNAASPVPWPEYVIDLSVSGTVIFCWAMALSTQRRERRDARMRVVDREGMLIKAVERSV